MVDSELADITVLESATVREVIAVLDRSPIKLALVVDGFSRLKATVTDGDVRRGLLAGCKLKDSVTQIARREFVAVGEETRAKERDEKLQTHGISFLPVLDSSGRVLELHSGSQAPGQDVMPNTVVIMAGGLGMRLRPMTETTPKPMLPLGGKPMLQHIIESLQREGFRDIVLSINYLGGLIEQHFGDGRDLGVRISYLSEPKPLGTGGALSLLDRDFDAPLVVMNGDVLMTAKVADIVNYHLDNEAEVTVGVKSLETEIPFGVFSLDGARIVGVEEKPTYRNYVNAGLYVLNPALIAEIPRGERFDMPSILLSRIGTAKALAFPLHESWMDVGRPADFDLAEKNYEAGKD